MSPGTILQLYSFPKYLQTILNFNCPQIFEEHYLTDNRSTCLLPFTYACKSRALKLSAAAASASTTPTTDRRCQCVEIENFLLFFFIYYIVHLAIYE